MTQEERRIYLIKALIDENAQYKGMKIPENDPKEQKGVLRALLNVRAPKEASAEFLKIQDEYLQNELAERGVVDYKALASEAPGLYLWQGDITTLRCDAIVNAANSAMLGCFYPNHGCVDNAVHTFAGVQLRLACGEIMKKQRSPEAPGGCKVTPAFNLPCKYVFHTVGPIVRKTATEENRAVLRSCYLSCMKKAAEIGVKSIAFCSVSAGEFCFASRDAASVAFNAVTEARKESGAAIDVIFNVFKDADREAYDELFKNYGQTRRFA